MKFEDNLASQLPSTALVSHAGICEPVTQYNIAGSKRGDDDFIHVLDTRGEHQCEFCHRIKACGARVEQQLTNFIAGRGAARLPRSSDGQPCVLQLSRKPL